MSDRDTQCKYIFLLAQQRSGTSALGSLLNNHPDIFYAGEVLNSKKFGKKNNFFTFYAERLRKDTDCFLPFHNWKIWDEFIDHIVNQNHGKIPFIDIKYNQTHILNGEAYVPYSTPWVVKHTLSEKYPIIHLTRDNFLRSFISVTRAKRTNNWHSKNSADISEFRLEVDISELDKHIKYSSQCQALACSWLIDKSNVFTIDYSNLFRNNRFLSDMAIDGISNLTGIENLAELESGFVKLTPDLLDNIVINIDELRNYLKDQGYEWLLE